MLKIYISNPRTVMLAITEGTTDIQTSECSNTIPILISALRFCRKFDPKGDRTLCILTKLDLVSSRDIPVLLDSLDQLPLEYLRLPIS